MNRTLKWILILLGGLVAVVVAALLIIPAFVDINNYKPQIEKQISEATGRPVTLSGDIELSLFPWAGISIASLAMGNPPGFDEKDFVSVESFEARVKLIPLLSKDIQVKRFIVNEPRIVLVKNAKGRGNWEMPKKAKKPSEKPEQPEKARKPATLPKDLTVGEFAIKNASLVFVDKAAGSRTEVKNINLVLENVSFDKPIGVNLSAVAMGFPISIDGKMGPVGKEIGKGTLPLDFKIKAIDTMLISLAGKVENPVDNPKFDLSVKIDPFSPKKLAGAFGQGALIATTDPNALDRLAFSANVKGDPKQVSITEGIIDLDQSKINLSAKVGEFNKPSVLLKMDLDKIDVDRYLPPPKPKSAEEKKTTQPSGAEKPVDYGPLRKLVLDARVGIGNLKVQKATIENIKIKLTAKDGRFQLEPLSMDLYQGSVLAKGSFDVKGNVPKTHMDLSGTSIQAGPLLAQLAQKDFLEGTAEFTANLKTEGTKPEMIKRSLNGDAAFTFKNGAIKGIDLHAMVEKAKALLEKGDISALTLSDTGGRTDFSRFYAPFTFNNGVATTTDTSMVTPGLRLAATGNTNLIEQSLDFRIEPKLVSTIKGQGDEAQREGLVLPLLVSGTWSKPKFKPDMKAVMETGMKKVVPELEKRLMEKMGGQKEEGAGKQAPEEQIKDIFKSLPFGKQQ